MMDRSAGDLMASYVGVERRRTPRIALPFMATARGIDTNSWRFEEHTVIGNLSAAGPYLHLSRRVAQGARLFVCIRLSNAYGRDAPAAYVAAHGVVARVEPWPGGVFGVAVTFTHCRFIYAVLP
jgi:hypothetical protein